ncbi:hypothetical protein GO755_00070 [Spirosoma sp. HMF4905]|uniref:Uncharacterized protein n=1 Tax=Spirosoma arboris TaxID=2682092 RepID=A0A7K1S3L5_9BACT|nr:hypothetical protein [Spirosoma arboris]MVM28407.1 hypothetical protein [Spirosoma arboris]
MGTSILTELDNLLVCPVIDGEKQITVDYLKALRLYVFAAAKYVCIVEREPIWFNEWTAAEWIEELGVEAIFSVIEYPEPDTLIDATDSEEQPKAQTIRSYKTNALSKLGIMPSAYADLTISETTALLRGVRDRELLSLQQTRIVASLLRNAHFAKPVSAQEFMPLPGDKPVIGSVWNDPKEAFYLLAQQMGSVITVEPSAN